MLISPRPELKKYASTVVTPQQRWCLQQSCALETCAQRGGLLAKSHLSRFTRFQGFEDQRPDPRTALFVCAPIPESLRQTCGRHRANCHNNNSLKPKFRSEIWHLGICCGWSCAMPTRRWRGECWGQKAYRPFSWHYRQPWY